MDKLWLLRGEHEAPGWNLLEKEARADEVDVLLFDRDAWALMRAAEAPCKYEGMTVSVPADGLYLDQHGRGVYVAAGELVQGPREVIAALGVPAQELLEKMKEPDLVLERLGRSF